MKSLRFAFVPFIALAAPFAAFAQSVSIVVSSGSCTGSICSVASTFLYLINDVAVPLIFALAFIIFIWGVFKAYIWSGGEAGAVADGHRLILWGIIGFVVMISLWGLVNVVSSTLGLGGYGAPPLPSSQSSSGYLFF